MSYRCINPHSPIKRPGQICQANITKNRAPRYHNLPSFSPLLAPSAQLLWFSTTHNFFLQIDIIHNKIVILITCKIPHDISQFLALTLIKPTLIQPNNSNKVKYSYHIRHLTRTIQNQLV